MPEQPRATKGDKKKKDEKEKKTVIEIEPPSGTRDFFPNGEDGGTSMRQQRWLFDKFREVASLYGFQEYDAPVLEHEQLYKRKAGEEITQQMYNFTDKDGAAVTLRPEMTPSLARMVLSLMRAETGEMSALLPLKWFSVPQCWRFETTQRGRKREHYQWNMDIVGVPGIIAEAELLSAICTFFERIGITSNDVGLKVNSRKVLGAVVKNAGVPDERFAETCVIIDKLDKIGPDEVCKELLEKVGLDQEVGRKIVAALNAKTLDEFASVAGVGESPEVQELRTLFELAADYGYGDWIQFDASVVRGLAYYTGVVFEGFDKAGQLRAICGGGRYDRLLSLYGSAKEVPCVGFGFGDCVVVELLKEKGVVPDLSGGVEYVVAAYNEAMMGNALSVARRLRLVGKTVDVFPDPGKKVGKAFNYADRCGAVRVAFVAPGEWEQGKVRIKDLRSFGKDAPDSEKQKDVPLDDLANVDSYFAGIPTRAGSGAGAVTATAPGAAPTVPTAPTTPAQPAAPAAPATPAAPAAPAAAPAMPVPGDVAGLDALLTQQPYVAGFRPTSSDAQLFAQLAKSEGRPGADRPALCRWYEHIESFMPGQRSAWPASSTPAPALLAQPADAAPKAPAATPKGAPAAAQKAAEKAPAAAPKEAPKASAPAPVVANGADFEKEVLAVGDQIRTLKEKLKADGLSGKKVNDHAEVKKLVAQLQALKEHAASSGAATSVAAKPPAAAQGASEEDARYTLLRSVGEECQTEAELRALLKRKPKFVLYDGFETSGRMHIAQGIFKAVNVNKCTKAGGTFKFWVADWFALMNDKMGGDLHKIKTVGKYFVEVWKAAGMDMKNVEFLWASDNIVGNAKEYWMQGLDIARRCNLARIKRCCTIMGRKEEGLTAAQILYPIMQCTDIFYLKADICQLGVDQRKVNMLARDYCDLAGRKEKPIILSHHMLYGLAAGQAKMSKSNPDSAVFVEDTLEDVARKIHKAYCPKEPEAASAAAQDDELQLVKDDLKNPCLDYVQHILFAREGYSFQAGGKNYKSAEDVKKAFLSGELSEKLLKDRLIEDVNALIEPVRKHFETDPEAKALLAQINEWKKETHEVKSTLTRLVAVEPESGPVFATFAPLPSEAVKLEVVLGAIARVRKAPKGSQVILYLEDWTAYTLQRVGGSLEGITAFYELLVASMRALAPELMRNVRVCWQGEMILSNPSDYWISVINAGRRISVGKIGDYLPVGEELKESSQVVTALMHIADVFALCGETTTTLCCDARHVRLHLLAAEECGACGLGSPVVEVCEQRSLRLLEGEGLEQNMHIFITDTAKDAVKKINKSYCLPGSVEFCPPLLYAGELLQYQPEFVVSIRDGGEKRYAKVDEVRDEFAAEALHPSDFKPAVSKQLNELLDIIRAEIKGSTALTKAQEVLDAAGKPPKKKK